MNLPTFAVSEIVACVGGAVLAEVTRPAPRWKDSIVNVTLGCFAGVYLPQGVEIWVERLERAHTLLIAVCSLSGAIVVRAFLAWLAAKKFMDMVGFLQRIIEAVRKPAPPAGGA